MSAWLGTEYTYDGVNIYVTEMQYEVEDQCLRGLAQSIPTME